MMQGTINIKYRQNIGTRYSEVYYRVPSSEPFIINTVYIALGYAVANLVEVATSIPDGVIGILLLI